MSKHVYFFLVFLFTALSTILVFAVCLLNDQTWIVTILYSLATMWICGIFSMLIMRHLYLSVAKPVEDEKLQQQMNDKAAAPIDTDNIENIEQIIEEEKRVNEKNDDE